MAKYRLIMRMSDMRDDINDFSEEGSPENEAVTEVLFEYTKNAEDFTVEVDTDARTAVLLKPGAPSIKPAFKGEI